MANDQLPYTEINATLTNILSELKGKKRELSSLKRMLEKIVYLFHQT